MWSLWIKQASEPWLPTYQSFQDSTHPVPNVRQLARRNKVKGIVDEEFKQQLIDRFTAEELIDLLCVTTEEVVERFSDEIEEAREDLEDFLKHGR